MSPYRPAARRWRELERERAHKHRDCPCGCGEMADECMSGRVPLAAFDIDAPERAINIHLDDEQDDA